MASHDRAFLDATVNRIWELRDRQLTAFRGDYCAYRRQRDERDAFAAKSADTQEQQIARERELVQTYRSHRKITKMHEHEARLERLLAAAQRRAQGDPQARAADAGLVGARARPVRRDRGPGRGPASSATSRRTPKVRQRATAPFLAARRGERIGIVGPNGAGKTTLLRTIAGELPPLDGAIEFGHQVQLGYLAQLRGGGASRLDGHRRAARDGPGHARRGARLPRAVPVPRRRRVQGGSP